MKWLQPSHFLKIESGKLIFWDYEKHQQFELSIEHLQRLIEFSKGTQPQKTPIDKEISEAEVLVNSEPHKKWAWDWLSHIFHYGTQHPLPPDSDASTEKSDEYAASYLEFCASIRHSMPEVEIIKGGKEYLCPILTRKN